LSVIFNPIARVSMTTPETNDDREFTPKEAQLRLMLR